MCKIGIMSITMCIANLEAKIFINPAIIKKFCIEYKYKKL